MKTGYRRHRLASVTILFLVVLGACHPRSGVRAATSAQTGDSPAKPTSASAEHVDRVKDSGPVESTLPLERSSVIPAKKFAASAGRATIERVARNAGGAVGGRDVEVVFGLGKTSIFHEGRLSARLGQQGYDAVIAPNGAHVAVMGAQHIEVVRVADGRVIYRRSHDKRAQDSPERRSARFLDNNTVVLFDGCQLWRTSLAKGEQPLGGVHCARPDADTLGERWFFRVTDESGDSGAYEISRVFLSDPKRTNVMRGNGDPPGITAFALGQEGRFACWATRRERQDLRCFDSANDHQRSVWLEPTDGRLAMDGDGHLAFATGSLRSPRDLYLADLHAGTVERIGHLDPRDEWLHFGSRGVLWVSGGQRLLRIDIEKRVQTTVSLPPGEWEGLSTSSDHPHRVYLGKERGSQRDLFRITVEP